MSRATRSESIPALLSLSEAAERLAVSTRTLRRMIARGELVGFRVGRTVRVRAEDVQALVQRIPTGGYER
jgi:excisionase family DNA binding protein